MKTEMKSYDSSEFVRVLQEKSKGKSLPRCPYCDGLDFTTPEEMATIFIAKDFNGVQIGPTVPSAMIICKTCGHINFFALGVLGMLPSVKKEDKEA